jgi:hypothetical protein
MTHAKPTYNLGHSIIRISVDRQGDFTRLTINGVDKTQDGVAHDAAIALIAEAGHNIQADISEAFDNADSSLYFRDDCYMAKRHAEDKLMEDAG